MPDYHTEKHQALVRKCGLKLLPLLPKYRSHKIIAAGKITKIKSMDFEGDGGGMDGEGNVYGFSYDLDCGTHGLVATMPTEWHHHMKPEVGQMLVVYDDGYVSVSPADKFEAGYTRVQEPNVASVTSADEAYDHTKNAKNATET